jgi:hypothetical protein
MKFSEVFGLTIGGILAVVLVVVLATGGRYIGWKSNQYFAPREEQVRRDTFEQSQAYNEGMRRDLEEIKDQYLATNDPASKAALRATFIHRAEGYPNQLPADLQSFYDSLKG